MNDYKNITTEITEILAEFIGNMHAPTKEMDQTDSVTITKDAALSTAIRMQRLANWTSGLYKTHEKYKGK